VTFSCWLHIAFEELIKQGFTSKCNVFFYKILQYIISVSFFQSHTDRRTCLQDLEALASQNRQHLNEMVQLANRSLSRASGQVVSTGRSGALIHRNDQLSHTDLNDNTSEGTLSQVSQYLASAKLRK